MAVAVLGAGRVRIGPEATESELANAETASIIHIAAHAVVDRERPERSAIVLASDDDHDGLMNLAELGALELDGTLVVLAACQGADGDLLAGEGPLSPARALFLGGARAVVASLWPVRDDEAAALFAELYRGLDEGMSVAEALAHAHRQRRRAGAPPSSWAGFVVYGDGSLHIARRPGPRALGWALLAASLVGTLIWGLGRLFRRQ